MVKVIKRDCTEVEFDKTKITTAILKAMKNGSGIVKPQIAENIADEIEELCKDKDEVYISDIELMVYDKLISKKQRLTARAYEGYRSIREFQREYSNTTDMDIIKLLDGDNDYWKNENANKNPVLNTTIRDYMAGIVSTDAVRRYLLSPEIVQAHDEGIIHFHDADYFIQHMHNCDLINLEDMLQNGTVISETLIEKPHSFSTACNIATQAIAQVASSQYGGQSISLAHLAPFVNISREKIKEEVKKDFALVTETYIDEESIINEIVERRLREEVKRGVQTIQYQLVTLMTTNGQAPFITIFMYLNEAKNEQEKKDLAILIEEMLRQRIQGVKNEDGVFVAPAFPKLIYVTEKDNITENSPYWYLTKLAAECSAKRLVPDYISEKMMLELKHDVYTCMGCRSFLTPDRFTDKGVGNIAGAKNYEPNKHKYYGRFNQGVVTISLPDIAFSSEGDMDKFWELFEERTELCHKALRARHERLKGTSSDVAPILWQYGALARLKKHEKIDRLLYDGYSTISLGYAGLYECVKYMTGHSHSDEGIGEAFGLEVMQALNDKCAQWKEAENIDYSLYGTPLESTTYKFAKCLKNRFGNDIFIKLDGFDRNYITNSYHIPVFEPIDAFEKLRIESKFQKLSPGGAISYIETPSMIQNVAALLEVIKYMYDNIMYAEINTKSCYCEKCGYDGDIPLVDENGTLKWICPKCGNDDNTTMDIAFRVCGYIGTAKNGGNQGRYGDIHDRVYHLDNQEIEL
ncbi:anaerobic ribonucleoside-triphosphate reductase [Blautia obeum]|jgi:ribonucleoside-triphosphate reductase|uniref:Anaerobic ribonucleoside-triphosphate reductase n=1 Tax=Blautia obeum TaxID=40520 RepID=A0A173ZUR6_9FIRM|nr:anaerobic ribonucleoside-triphosphate reductase [Blautia obeum]CUN80041.1 Anaerobic ribonucleoside-triphosphate reductase [Blautia obeum]